MKRVLSIFFLGVLMADVSVGVEGPPEPKMRLGILAEKSPESEMRHAAILDASSTTAAPDDRTAVYYFRQTNNPYAAFAGFGEYLAVAGINFIPTFVVAVRGIQHHLAHVARHKAPDGGGSIIPPIMSSALQASSPLLTALAAVTTPVGTALAVQGWVSLVTGLQALQANPKDLEPVKMSNL